MRAAAGAFLLGLAALGGEVAVAPLLARLLGNTNVTLGLLLAVWMVGLLLGARWSGSVPARLAAFGLTLSLAALPFVLWALWRADPSGGPVGRLSGAVAALALLFPPFFGGALFPWFAGKRGGGGAYGWTLALETAGACAGALLGGFFLPSVLGYRAALLLLAAAALPLVGLTGGGRRSDAALGAARHEPTLLLAVALSGLAVLALELIWTRILLFFVPGVASSLAGVLAGVLLGAALGAALGARAPTRSARGAGALAAAVGAFLGACALVLLPRFAEVLGRLPQAPGGGFAAGGEMLAALALGLAVAGPAAAGSAALQAACAKALGGATHSAAARVYGAACLGSALGALVAALSAGALLPLRTAAACATALLFVAASLAARGPGPRIALALAAVAAVTLAPRSGTLLEHSSEMRRTYARGRKVLAERQDAHVVASVVELEAGRGRALYTNAFLSAATSPEYGYMRLLGHLPVLLAERPERVFVVGYGTGTTAGAVSLHPEVSGVVICEVSPAVYSLSSWFEAVNRGFPWRSTAGKDVSVVFGDGRRHLLDAGRGFGVITLEPLPPYAPHAVHFYTREFYRQALARLAKGGVLCQWIPLHTQDRSDFEALVGTFARAVPGAALYVFDQCALLVGGREPERLDVGRILDRLRSEPVLRDLEAARVGSAASLVAARICGRERLLRACAEAPDVTDDRPIVALRFAPAPARTRDYLAEACRLLVSWREPVAQALDLDRLDEGAKSAFLGQVEHAAEAKRLLLLARAEPSRAAAHLSAALRLAPSDPEVRAFFEASFGVPAPAAPTEEQPRPPPTREALLRAFLSDDLDRRLEAAVEWRRRFGDLGPLDPFAGPAERRRAVERLRGG